MNAERVVYSIQRTYIIKPVIKQNNLIFTCDERIDIPTIEPVTTLTSIVCEVVQTVVPCVELKIIAGSLEGANLVFETNEGATVLPVKIDSGEDDPLGNPYIDERYVLVLPRGTTGIKTCKIIVPELGEEYQNTFTFGIMPPPYNYDNALLGCMAGAIGLNSRKIVGLDSRLANLTERVTALENKSGG